MEHGKVDLVDVVVVVQIGLLARGCAVVGYGRAGTATFENCKVILIDFVTTWCAPCKKMDKTTWKDKKVRAWLGEKTVALKIDAEKEKKLAKDYRVEMYPTIVLLKADGFGFT